MRSMDARICPELLDFQGFPGMRPERLVAGLVPD
jgi:hypothetical protein